RHEVGRDEAGLFDVLPRHRAKNGDVHREVEQLHASEREKNRARDHSPWIGDLSAEITHIVVTPVVVYGDQKRRAQACEERVSWLPCADRKRKRLRWAEVSQTAEDNGKRRSDYTNPQERAEPADDRDSP